MTALSKAWVTIADTAVDPDSPLDAALMTGLRDDLVHLREWIGASYTAGAVQDHNHDGVNSAAIDTGVLVKNGSFETGTTAGWTQTLFTGGSAAINTANHMDGANALAITSTVLANGGGQLDAAAFSAVTGGLRDVLVTLAVKASVANISSKAEVVWYDNTQAQISISTVYTSTNTPTAASMQVALITPPSTARYFKLRLTGGIPASGTATGTVYFDGVQAIAGLMVTGLGQTWQDVGASRTSGTNYTNTTGKPIMVAVTCINGTAATNSVTVGGVNIASFGGDPSTGNAVQSFSFIVPNGVVYSVNSGGGINKWAELR